MHPHPGLVERGDFLPPRGQAFENDGDLYSRDSSGVAAVLREPMSAPQLAQVLFRASSSFLSEPGPTNFGKQVPPLLLSGSADKIDGLQGDMNESRLREKQFTDDQARALVFSVRRSGVSLTVNGRRILDWKGDSKRLSISPAFAVPDERVLFLMTGATGYEVSRVILMPISGAGQKLR
jgi:hypothetical protein